MEKVITLTLKPKFAEVIDNPALSKEEKIKFIVDDTVAYFGSTNRCYGQLKEGSSGCAYHPATIDKTIEQTEGCAVGRLFDEESAKVLDEVFTTVKGKTSSIECIVNDREGVKLPQFIVDNVGFFAELQDLHDSDYYWLNEEVSESGKKKVTELLTEF